MSEKQQDPTEDEIAEKCAEFRKKWKKSRLQQYETPKYIIPIIPIDGLVLEQEECWWDNA